MYIPHTSFNLCSNYNVISDYSLYITAFKEKECDYCKTLLSNALPSTLMLSLAKQASPIFHIYTQALSAILFSNSRASGFLQREPAISNKSPPCARRQMRLQALHLLAKHPHHYAKILKKSTLLCITVTEAYSSTTIITTKQRDKTKTIHRARENKA